MKTGQNRAKVKTNANFFKGFTTAAFLAVSCLIAEGQNIRIEKKGEGNQAIIDFTPKVQADSQTLLEYMVSDDLVKWTCAKIELIGPGGDKQWVVDFGDTDADKKFFKLLQTDINDAGLIDKDNDGDHISTLYELLSGMDPLVPLVLNPNSSEGDPNAISIHVADTEIAAGGLDSEPHKTKVTVTVGVPNIPVKVWLVGESGKLEKLYGESFVAGDMISPGQQALQVETNSEGIAELVLTSSDIIDDSCVVHACIGDIYNSDETKQPRSESELVRFMQGEMQISLNPSPLQAGGNAKALVRRLFKGKPLVGHRIGLSVDRAKVFDEELKSSESGSLDDYATIGSGDSNISYYTNEAGECSIDFGVSNLEALQSISLKATDLSQTLK